MFYVGGLNVEDLMAGGTGCCYTCREPFYQGDEYRITPTSKGFLIMVHNKCLVEFESV